MKQFERTTEKYIYKYMPINYYTLKCLINNELYFGIPLGFNDPLDCKFRLKVEPTPSLDSVRQFYQSENLSEIEIRNKLSIFENDSNVFLKDIEDSYVNNLRRETGISCFSEKFDSILMWAHYADKHKGICLKFEWQKDSKFFMGAKVNYSNELPTIIYDGKGQLDITPIVLTKMYHWEYEEEVRSIIKIENGIHTASFHPEALAGVIFGEKANASDKMTIINALNLNKGYSHLEISNSKINLENLKVEILV